MKQKLFFLTRWALAVLMLPVFTTAGFADDGELLSLVKNMSKKMESMEKTIDTQNRKISALESRGSSTAISSGSESAPAPMSDYEFNQRLESSLGGANKWLKDLKFGGDLRLRYEAFRTDNGLASGNNERDYRNRFRYRLRYGFEKKFNEDLNIGFAMASGERSTNAADPGINVDPTSTNTSFDNNFNFKDVFIEKAFASYSPSLLKGIGPIKSGNITAGKMNNPFEKGSSDLVWDRDVKPEGLSEKMDFGLLDTENFDLAAYGTMGQFVLDEDNNSDGDANLYAFQMGVNPTFYLPGLERPVDHLSAVSLYNYDNYARKSNFLIGTTSLARGNPNADSNAAELDTGDFVIWEYYGEIGIAPMGLPTKFFYDFAKNAGNESLTIQGENNAYALGVKLGTIVEKGDWEVGYAWKQIGANAVTGFNDSDFGTGHSGKKGSVFKGAYALMDNLTLNSAAFFVENMNPASFGVTNAQERRFQVDMSWKF